MLWSLRNPGSRGGRSTREVAVGSTRVLQTFPAGGPTGGGTSEITHHHNGLDGREVTEYPGVVSGEAVIGANVVSDVAAGIRDVVGGRSESYEKKIETGRQEAIGDLRTEARELDADAVVGASFDYEAMSQGMLWVNLSGTAVRTRVA